MTTTRVTRGTTGSAGASNQVVDNRPPAASPNPQAKPATEAFTPAATPRPGLGERIQMEFWSLVEKMNNRAAAAVSVVRDPVPVVYPRHGVVAFDPGTREVTGDAGGAFVADAPLMGIAPRGMATFHTLPMEGIEVTYQVQGHAPHPSGKTDATGFQPTTLEELTRDGLNGLDPQRGGVVKIGISAEGKSAEQRILALPKDYDGPIFVSDLNLTLRDVTTTGAALGKDYKPIEGTDTLLKSVAAKGVPIIYVSGGFEAQGPWNERFMRQYPDGPLLIRPSASMVEIGSNATADRNMGSYKNQTISKLQQMFPKAQWIGFGDDKHEDPEVYSDLGFGANTFIRNSYTPEIDVPANFTGQVAQTGAIDAEFRGKVLAAVDQAIARSKSFKA